jgi:hypothetical protein
VHRTAAKDGQVGGTHVGGFDLHLLEYFAERHGQRAIEHDAERAFLAVLADQ